MKTLEQRFFSKVDQVSTKPCWHWTGYKTKAGHGQINLGCRGKGLDYAHRVSFLIHHRPLVEGEKVIQICKKKSCVNPEHLHATFEQQDHICVDVKERLMSRIEVTESGCWEYQQCKSKHGYGRLGYGPRELGVQWAHILSWEIHNGEIPFNLCVLHKCDNPPCVNPEHLFLGTQTENVYDCIDKGRMWYQK